MITVRKSIAEDLDNEFRNVIIDAEFDISQAFTIMDDGKVAAVIGCVEYCRGVGHVWALVAMDVKNGLGMTRAARKLLKKTMDEKGYHRIQTYTNLTYTDRKWARLCGFECEALLEKMSPNGEDYWIYKSIRRT